MLKTIIALILFLSLGFGVNARERFFQVQSVDTMKFSRDEARGKSKDQSFDREIDIQIKNIAEIGATHVAIGTPYDDEFTPFMRRWVFTIRKHNLKVWFRGNLSGWENWFGYPKINRQAHTSKIRQFIMDNKDLFEDGDIFTSCPECENGGPGDPRKTGDVEGFRNFIISEYGIVKDAFKSIEKNVTGNYYSMNGDVARLIMDRETTNALDQIVTIDHYVGSSDRLVNDIKDYNSQSGGMIVLGEFGAPIPDIHGDLSKKDQARWVDSALNKIVNTKETVAINYWTNMHSSTQLWDDDHTPRPVVAVLARYFNPANLTGIVTDELERPLDDVEVKAGRKTSSAGGKYILPVIDGESVLFSKEGYVSVSIKAQGKQGKDVVRNVTMMKKHPSFIYTLFLRIIQFFKNRLL